MSRRDNHMDRHIVERLPEWLLLLAPVVFVGAIVASVFWPWGWAL